MNQLLDLCGALAVMLSTAPSIGKLVKDRLEARSCSIATCNVVDGGGQGRNTEIGGARIDAGRIPLPGLTNLVPAKAAHYR